MPVNMHKINGLFANYANDSHDDTGATTIGPNGMLRLLTDLKLEPTDRRVLLLACKLQAQTQCEFSWDEFEKGISQLEVDTLDKLRQKLNQLDAELTDKKHFRELYQFTFKYGKPVSQRSMDLDSACIYWRILFKDMFPLIDEWEAYLRKEHGTGISFDEWKELLNFCYDVKKDLSNYDFDESWPDLMDKFVDYMRSKSAK